ncbi:MAG: hypothetical protein D6785_07550 [Planctomycetota bacterium]|nr:MAG: hypothetical protein D6785_07550 [Planctomycetota bacterium]
MMAKKIDKGVDLVREILSSFLHLEIPKDLPLNIQLKKKGKDLQIEGQTFHFDVDSSHPSWKERVEREVEAYWESIRDSLLEKIVDYLNENLEEKCTEYVKERLIELHFPEEKVERIEVNFADFGEIPSHWEMEEELLFEQPFIGIELTHGELEDNIQFGHVLEEIPQNIEDCAPVLDELIARLQENWEEEDDFERNEDDEEEVDDDF